MKRLLFIVFLMCGLAGLILSGPLVASAQNMPKAKEFRIERSMPKEAVACIQCHKTESPGIFADWAHSRHANANITCYDCHKAEEFDPDVSKEHYKQYERSDLKYGTKEYRYPSRQRSHRRIAPVVTRTSQNSMHRVSTPIPLRSSGRSIHGCKRE